MAHEHGHGHHAGELTEGEVRARALESLLRDKGLLSGPIVDEIVETYSTDIGPLNGARAVAKAWTDAGFRQRLLADATAALQELGIGGMQGEHMVAVENTEAVHNVVVCTLCSCYPWPVLGLPPSWYKDAPYRARIVREPRAVLAEFGTSLPETVELRVWDSSAEMRYLVLPRRPRSTDGMSEDDLAELVTRDSMIGVTVLPDHVSTVDAGAQT